MRYAAFLRGVNLGKRTVKSAELRSAFEAMGFAEVKTLLASGNVLFDARSAAGLKERIEDGLRDAFGFEVPVVLRSLQELRAMVEANPFGREAGEDAQLHVLLMDRPLPRGYSQAGLAGDFDVARAEGADIYYIVYRKEDGTYLGRSDLVPGEGLPKGAVMTMRNWNTILKAIA